MWIVLSIAVKCPVSSNNVPSLCFSVYHHLGLTRGYRSHCLGDAVEENTGVWHFPLEGATDSVLAPGIPQGMFYKDDSLMQCLNVGIY